MQLLSSPAKRARVCRFSCTWSGLSPTWSPRFRLCQGGRLTPPLRVVHKARTRRGAGQSGRSTSCSVIILFQLPGMLAQGFNKVHKIVRQGYFPGHNLAGFRVLQGQLPGMQGLPVEGGQYFPQLFRGALGQTQTPAIGRIAHQRVAHVGHVHTDLVGTAAFQFAANMGMSGKALNQPVVGHRRFAGRHHRHALAVLRVPANGSIYCGAAGERTHHHRLVFPAHGALLQLVDQRGVGNQAAGHHHNPGGVFVQPVHNTSPGQVLDFRRVIQQRVHQGAIGMARGRVYHQPGRFVDHQQVLVFVHDIQGDGLGFPGNLHFRLGIQLQNIVQHDFVTGLAGFAVHRQRPAFDPGLQARAGMLGHEFGRSLIQPPDAQLRGDGVMSGNTVIGRHSASFCYNAGFIQVATIIRDSGMRSVVRLLLISTIIALASGCASNREVEVLPEETYYQNARQALNSGNFNEAEQNLDALETYYPFVRYAEQAQLDLIFARYQNLDLEGSRAAADRFMRLNPQSDHLDYAMYMRGLASYNLDMGLAARYFPIDVAARSPGEQLQAFRDFSQLLNRFPDSEYAPDARQRMIAIRNRMAELELHAARYYIKREAFVAANNRARYVVENFPSSPAVEEALILLADTFRFMDLKKGASDAIATLRQNFPNSEAFDENGEFQSDRLRRQNRSLTNVVTFGLMGDE